MIIRLVFKNMSGIALVILSALVVLASPMSSFAQKNENAEGKIERIRKEVEAVMLTENIPAISLVVVKNGEEPYHLNFGHHDRNQIQAVDENSIYQLASLGKMLAGIIARNLLLEGKIHLDQPVTDFVEFKMSAKVRAKLGQMTILELLHHHAGVPRNARAGYDRNDGDPYLYDYGLADLEKDLQKMKIKSAGKFSYSNFGYALLGYIFEQATGMSYDELLQKYVCEPYELETTQLELEETLVDRIVTPYRKENRSVATQGWRMGKLGPPSAVFCTTRDLGNLLVAQLEVYRNSNLDSQRPLVLTENTVSAYNGTNISYGYGMFDWGNGTFGHGGDMDGYGSDYAISPKGNFGVALLTSSGGRWISPLIRKINGILGE